MPDTCISYTHKTKVHTVKNHQQKRGIVICYKIVINKLNSNDEHIIVIIIFRSVRCTLHTILKISTFDKSVTPFYKTRDQFSNSLWNQHTNFIITVIISPIQMNKKKTTTVVYSILFVLIRLLQRVLTSRLCLLRLTDSSDLASLFGFLFSPSSVACYHNHFYQQIDISHIYKPASSFSP